MQFNLIGPSYESQSPNADGQRTVNWFPEVIESGTGKSKVALYPTPGTKSFTAITGGGDASAHISSVEIEHALGNRANVTALEVLDEYAGAATAGATVGSHAAWSDPDNVASATDYATSTFPATPTTKIYPTINKNGWTNELGPFEMGVDQSTTWGVDTCLAYDDATKILDGFDDTYAKAVDQHTHQYRGITLKFATAPAGKIPKTLSITSKVLADGEDGYIVNKRSAGVWWRHAGAAEWTQVYNEAHRVLTTDAVALPAGLDLSTLEVMCFSDAHDDMAHYVYDVHVLTIPASECTDYLDASDMDFAVPLDQTISGVEVSFDSCYTGDITQLTYHAQLMSAGIVVGNVVAGTLAGPGTLVFPDTTDWGITFSPALINASNAGVRIYVSAARTAPEEGQAVWIRNVKATAKVLTYLRVTTNPAHGYSVDDSICFTRMGANIWLNDQNLTVGAVTSTTFEGIYDHAVMAQEADTGFAWDGGLCDPYVIIKLLETCPFLNGQTVTFSAVGISDFLNGHSSSILTHDSAGFTAPFDHADYGPVSETLGMVLLGDVSNYKTARAMHEINGRCFTASGTNFFEVLSDGTYTILGGIADDGTPVSMASTAEQVVICSAGHLYLLTLATNAFDPISDTEGLITNVARVEYADGYFIALLKDSRQFRISGIEDGATWDPLDITTISVFPDNATAMIVDHREIWIWGGKKAVVYYNSGNADFPWEVISSGYIDQGCAALHTPVRLDNSVFWLGQDERGYGIVWRANGYSPQRVSNHALEYAIQGYSRIDDAIAYGFQMDGHSYYHLYFPTPSKSWRYDCATGAWCEVAYLRDDGEWEAHHSQCHCFAFKKHLVGDWGSGNVYELSMLHRDDNGQDIKRVRRSPHISDENKWLHHFQLVIDAECGLGLEDGQGSDPQLMVRWSDDGGHVWSNEHWMTLGKIGEFKARAILRKLGRSRDRVYEISCTEPIPVRIINGYLEAS